MKTRRQAAIELQPIYNSMEVRKNSIATLMRKLWFDGTNWRCNGIGYDMIIQSKRYRAMETINQNQEKSLLESYDWMKSKHPDAVFLFRTGDNYESYKQDAKRIGRILNIGVTKQEVGDMGNIHIVSFPMRDLDMNLPKLIRGGLRVAICDKR